MRRLEQCQYLDADAVVVQQWVSLLCSVLSCFASVLLIALCCRLRRTHPGQLLPLQLRQLATVDLAEALWESFADAAVLAGQSSLWWCAQYMLVLRWLMTTALALCACLAVGLLCQIRRWEAPWVLWWGAWVVLPLALLLNLGYVIKPSVPDDEDSAMLCRGQGPPGDVFAFQAVVIFLVTALIHMATVSQAFQASPHSVVRRSALSASRYVLAFICTYVVFLFYHLWEFFDRDIKQDCVWAYARIAGTWLTKLGGLFNFLAFWAHASQIRRRMVSDVGFHREGSLQEVFPISHHDSARRSAPSYRRRLPDASMDASLLTNADVSRQLINLDTSRLTSLDASRTAILAARFASMDASRWGSMDASRMSGPSCAPERSEAAEEQEFGSYLIHLFPGVEQEAAPPPMPRTELTVYEPTASQHAGPEGSR